MRWVGLPGADVVGHCCVRWGGGPRLDGILTTCSSGLWDSMPGADNHPQGVL